MSETAKSADALLSSFVDPDQLKKDTNIDLLNITGAMQQQTGLYVHYAVQAVRARRQHERYKRAVELLEARLNNQYRLTLKEESAKVTEDQIRSAVLTDPAWKAAAARALDAQHEFRIAEIAERAFDHRKDMLLQIARDAARESAGPLRVATNQNSRERLVEMMGTRS